VTQAFGKMAAGAMRVRRLNTVAILYGITTSEQLLLQ